MKWPCSKCGLEADTAAECPRCAAMKAKYPDLIEYVEACIEKTKEDAAEAEWERSMGDDL